MTRHKSVSVAALVIALLALVASLGGGSFAAAVITGKDIKNNSITGKDVKNKSIKGNDIKDKSLTGKDVKDGSLAAGDLAAGTLDRTVTSLRVTATAGATQAAARAAAPEQVLYTAGPFTVYGKCYTDTSGPTTYASAYIRTSASGAILSSANDTLEGPDAVDFLNTDTLEEEREIEVESAGTNGSNYFRSVMAAHAVDGTAVSGVVAAGAKNGTPAGGNGAYGAGDACVFSAELQRN